MTLLNSMTIAVAFMAALGLFLAVILAFANKRLFVYEDPRIDQVEELLPHANCGACGTAGCRAFAEKLVTGKLQPAQCTVNSREMNQVIADFLGVDVGKQVKRVARLACAGGNHVAKTRAKYTGLKGCRAAALVAGGGRGCTWGCLGLGDCERVCEFVAIVMDRHGLPRVDEDKCTACGDCVEICPRDLFSLQPIDHHLWVACKNRETGDEAEAECAVVCTGCGLCAADSPAGLIAIVNDLAVIDYAKNRLASQVAIQRCPTGAIVWLGENATVSKGKQAKKIVRNSPLPIG